MRRAWGQRLVHQAPAVLAAGLILSGVLAVAVRLDAPADGTVVSSWQTNGVVVGVANGGAGDRLQDGDVVTTIAGRRLADGLGGLARPEPGQELSYQVVRDVGPLALQIDRADPYPLLAAGWGNLLFVFALAGLATALYLSLIHI